MDDANGFGLEGRSALITGSTSGIGRAVALAFARAGCARLVLNGPPGTEDAGEETCEALGGLGSEARYIPADLSEPAECARLAEEAESWTGGIEILVNNAGIAHGDLVEDLPLETWDRVMAIHARATFLMIRALIPGMYARGYGRIVNTVSQLAYKGAPGLGAYTAAKGAVLSLTRSVALEIGQRDVRINCVAPGATKTPILDAVEPAVLEEIRAAIPVGALATPEQIAPAYVFLASGAGDHFQGQCISPNGGDQFL